MTVKTKKIAIFYTDHYAEWTDPYGNFDEMAQNLLTETKPSGVMLDIEYEVFQVCKGIFPTLKQLLEKDDDGSNRYIGIFITGSRYDSFSNDIDWIIKMREMLPSILLNDEYPPVTGICFGHQIIACSLGAKVDRNPLGFEGGVIPIELNETGIQLFGGKKLLNISELHNDVVFETPKQVKCWGSTPKCANQGFYKPGRLLTFQGHPEFTSAIAKNGYEMTYHKTNSKIDLQEYKTMKKNTSSLNNDGKYAASTIWDLYLHDI